MARPAIVLASALAATVAHAQAPASGQRFAASPDKPKPFLFDGRMKGDGAPPERRVDARDTSTGTIVGPPKGGRAPRE